MLTTDTGWRYDRVARGLHWSMAGLIVVTFAFGLVVDAFPKHWEHAIVETHKVIGLAILTLVLVRILWRLSHKPHPLEGISATGRQAAFLGHLALYLLMVGVPAIGLGYAILRGQGLDFGLFSLPALMPADRARAARARGSRVGSLCADRAGGVACAGCALAPSHSQGRRTAPDAPPSLTGARQCLARHDKTAADLQISA